MYDVNTILLFLILLVLLSRWLVESRSYWVAKTNRAYKKIRNWKRSKWEWHKKKIAHLGINPDLISPELLDSKQHFLRKDGPKNKARMADQLDVVFDDHADHIQHLTKTPIMKCPGKKAKKRPSDEDIIDRLKGQTDVK